MKAKNIRMIVACTNANGSPDLFSTVLKATEKQISEGDHYDMVKIAAHNAGYEGKMVAFEMPEFKKALHYAMMDNTPTVTITLISEDNQAVISKFTMEDGEYKDTVIFDSKPDTATETATFTTEEHCFSVTGDVWRQLEGNGLVRGLVETLTGQNPFFKGNLDDAVTMLEREVIPCFCATDHSKDTNKCLECGGIIVG